MADFVTPTSIRAIFHELTKALEQSPQTDFDDFAKRIFCQFGKDPKQDKAARKLTEDLAVSIRATGIFSGSDADQPFASTAVVSPPPVQAAERTPAPASAALTIAPVAAPVVSTQDPEALPGPRSTERLVPFQPDQINNWKKALLLAATIVDYALATTLTAGVWNEVRGLPDQPLRNPDGGLNLARVGSEAGAAAIAAGFYPALLKALPAIQAKLMGIAAFTGEVGKIIQFLRWVFTSAIGGTGLYAGVKAGLHASTAHSDGEHFEEWMFAGYFVAFMILITGNFIGARLSGQHVSYLHSEQSWVETGKTIGAAFFNDFASIIVWVNERIPNFIVWFAYEFYAAYMGPEKAALWGSLAIFVASYKVAVEMIGAKVIEAPGAGDDGQGENEGGMNLDPVQQ